MAKNRVETPSISRSPNSNKAALEREWEKFMSGTSSQLHVRTPLRKSWQRCIEQGVNPLVRTSSYHVGMDQIQEYVTGDPLFRRVEPFLKKLKQLAANTGYLAAYSNATGELVYFNGDMPLLLQAEDINFAPGSNWSESIAGTNAIGTTLATGLPLQVFAGEHYCQEFHNWTCSAAPIRDPATGQVLGIIDLTGFWTVNDPKSLDAVIRVARDIENMLRCQLKFERYRLSQCFVELTKRTTLPVAVIDRGGRVIKASGLLYEKGWISPHHRMRNAPNLAEAFPLRGHWEMELDNKKWLFELSPYFYGGSAIGSIITVLPPDLAVFKHVPDFRHIPEALRPPKKDVSAETGGKRFQKELLLSIVIRSSS